MRAVAALVACAGCATSLRNGNRAGVAGAALSLACDAGQTIYAERDGHYPERNPMLGRFPSESSIETYFAGVAIATVITWWLLPERARPAIWAPVVGVEAAAIEGNLTLRAPIPMCGI